MMSGNGTGDADLKAKIAKFLPHYAEGPIIKGFGRGSSELGNILLH